MKKKSMITLGLIILIGVIAVTVDLTYLNSVKQNDLASSTFNKVDSL